MNREDQKPIRLFTEDNSVDAVTSRMDDCDDPRLRQVMEVVVRKLHEAVKEIEPTEGNGFKQSNS